MNIHGRIIIAGITVFVAFVLAEFWQAQSAISSVPVEFAQTTLFKVQSIDTMKDSRDRARDEAENSAYDKEIDRQMSIIKEVGANYAAIDVPYDKEFVPMLERWVTSARRHGLKIWFRGNLSGWEGWFGYQKIGREAHIKGVEDFILSNPKIFEDGDIFSGCPECENGGTGDPRSDGDIASYRKFLTNEHDVFTKAFRKIGRKVTLYAPMNADVARLVMDKETTKAMGGIVVIDHYTNDLARLEKDIRDIHEESGGKIILGEFGAPIPDIHGDLTPNSQANFVRGFMSILHRNSEIVEGANYWTLRYGSTALVNDDLSLKPVLAVLSDYYEAPFISGIVKNTLGKPIANTRFMASLGSGLGVPPKQPFMTDGHGRYQIFLPNPETELSVFDENQAYASTTLMSINIDENANSRDIILAPIRPNLFYKFKRYFRLY